MDKEKQIFPAHHRITDDRIQSVEEHLAGVREKCERYARQLNFESTGSLAGILHDIGKYTDEFREYFEESVRREKAGEPELKRTVDHGRHGAMLILERYHGKGINSDVYRKIMAEILSMIICYHHGGMEDFLSENLELKLLKRCRWSDGEGDGACDADPEYIRARERFFQRVIPAKKLDELFDASAKEFKAFFMKLRNGGGDADYGLHLLVKFLYSCLIDADRYDTYLFMQKAEEEKEVEHQALWEEFSRRLEVKEEELRKKEVDGELARNIKGLRQEIWQQCSEFGGRPEGIYTLTVPTGGGKTLSSLRYALNHARQRKKKLILYVLPFTAIIEQNAAVVRDTLEAGKHLLEHHSNVAGASDSQSNGKETSGKKTGENEENECRHQIEYRQLLTEQWTSPIIFTTMVQFLNTFFSGGTKNIRRLHNLTDVILIFDEVQALPIKCISLFNEAINFLWGHCRDTIILCSATQPGLHTVKHRMNTGIEMIPELEKKFHAFKRMAVVDKTREGKMSLARFGAFISELKSDEESILIIMNTKSLAEAVFREVRERIEDSGVLFFFLSTNLCSAHRKKIIKEIKEALAAHRQVVCVSTQLIEAGVDISFSCVVRHLAGLDSVAQASGRGNRNGEGEIKNTYIVALEEEHLGTLEDITAGEEAAGYVLDEYRRDSEKFNHDLLSPIAVRRYYEYFYSKGEVEKKMDYPVDKTSIFSMLSRRNLRNEYKNSRNENCPLTLEFQLKAAAEAFEVIDEFAEGVLVPFGEGKGIIAELQAGGGPLPGFELIRSAQPYMVNVSRNTMRRLLEKEAVYVEKRSGVRILRENFYDKELGVVPEGGKMETLQWDRL